MKLSYYIIIFISLFASCKKFIQVNPPRTELVKSTVFESDATANAAMLDIYYSLRTSTWASGSSTSITLLGTYSSDEQLDYSNISSFRQFNDNQVAVDNEHILSLWSGIYKIIHSSNAIIEGLSKSEVITQNLKAQLEGESKFIRAFCFFYLVNLFGDVPLTTTTDYKVNATMERTSQAKVYNQIISDLTEAKDLLPGDYAFAGEERVRSNKASAAALLARVYLFMHDWENAEIQSNEVILNTNLYELKDNLDEVFLTNSREAILQWWSDFRPLDRASFRILSDPPTYGAFRSEFANGFEVGDLRYSFWVAQNFGYSYAYKYKSFQDNPPLAYSTVLRLAEQYLIRAEARANQNKLLGANSAESDINIIRSRAGLPNTAATTQQDILSAIENERKWELFAEWGHRWFDLKRTQRADAVLAAIKGSIWQITDTLYPLPQYQILNSSLGQNPGY